ncbi:MAG: GIY-YIG nuclease family protein [Chlorobi bacterium]|nr:GIY-YIG nuclease family protein [Chlorobiota bacterium]
MKGKQFTLSCGTQRQGTYLLFIRLSEPVHLVFGKFLRGKPLFLPAGNYLYLGSALGRTGNGSALARRLLRHASRTAGKKPHAIHEAMVKLLQEKELAPESTPKPLQKKLHWHIDYLLDTPGSAIFHILIIRSPEKLEPVLARYLEAAPETSVPAARLGAQDTRNSTHLLSCSDPEGLLERLRRELPDMTGQRGFHSC